MIIGSRQEITKGMSGKRRMPLCLSVNSSPQTDKEKGPTVFLARLFNGLSLRNIQRPVNSSAQRNIFGTNSKARTEMAQLLLRAITKPTAYIPFRSPRR